MRNQRRVELNCSSVKLPYGSQSGNVNRERMEREAKREERGGWERKE